jgi:hypothetical protein
MEWRAWAFEPHSSAGVNNTGTVYVSKTGIPSVLARHSVMNMAFCTADALLWHQRFPRPAEVVTLSDRLLKVSVVCAAVHCDLQQCCASGACRRSFRVKGAHSTCHVHLCIVRITHSQSGQAPQIELPAICYDNSLWRIKAGQTHQTVPFSCQGQHTRV